ncbi:MAG: hypothetical protein KF729_32040 [Sandaracinaceae bacterium]|nr:hypothetical protein [Sandaracinaceae bacterium]
MDSRSWLFPAKGTLACALMAGASMFYGCDGGTSTPSGHTFPARDHQCAAGAATPCMTTEPESPDANRTVELPNTFMDRTITYVVATASLPQMMGGRAAGFNVDNLDSGAGSMAADANCQEYTPDFVSVTDANHRGVDNALQGLVGTIEGLLDANDCPGMMTRGCLDATLQRQILEGDFLLLMEVGGINDFTFDSSVTVQLYLGTASGTLMEAPGGGLAGGQTFTRGMALGAPVTGDIFNGRLRVQTPSLPLNINAGGFELNLVVTQAQVRFDITENRLANGVIGGVVTVDAIVMAAVAIMPGIEDTVRSVVESVADVSPSADPQVCTALSLGLLFTGVDATY